MSFEANFLWGAASSSYQIEGAATADGKGLSIWDLFSHTEGRTWQGQTADVACDHYHRFAEDVALMREIGLRSYRFSICWPRVLPGGVGTSNPAGLDFYSRLVDALLAANIEPVVTLFHWDFPLDLYYRGGWLNRDVAQWFADYAGVVVRHLGDRVKHWITLNEPAAVTGAGHYWGVHAPGTRFGVKETLRVGLHTLLAHGQGVQAIRAASPQPCQIGTAFDFFLKLPASSSLDDIEAARRLTLELVEPNVQANALWLDPALRGEYPTAAAALFGDNAPTVTPDDLKIIHQPLDFLGVNCYYGTYARMNAEGQPETLPYSTGHPALDSWYLTPEALYWGPRLLYERFGLPLMITENGAPNADWVALDGGVHDPQRIDFMHRYLQALARAVEEGIPVKGYFYWSILDNFEWKSGYRYRFGLVHVDYDTLQRTLKDSAYWYRDLIAQNGAALFSPVQLSTEV
jgi:beta-glucosidase